MDPIAEEDHEEVSSSVSETPLNIQSGRNLLQVPGQPRASSRASSRSSRSRPRSKRRSNAGRADSDSEDELDDLVNQGEMSTWDLIKKYFAQLQSGNFDQWDLDSLDHFDKANKNLRLEEQIKLPHLEQLMQEFSQHNPPDILIQEGTGYFPPKVKKREKGLMNLSEFKETIYKVLLTNEYDDYLEKLFMKLDTSCDGYVDWNEFCTYLLLLYRENDYLATKREIPFLVEPKIRHIVHNRQEQTTRIVATSGPVRYVTISKEGAMTVWQPNMVQEKQYTISEGEEDQSAQKRRFKMWVTDAVYMQNCQKIAVASTSRDIRFYDVSSSQYFEEYHLFAMADVPYCLDYYYNKKNENSDSLLVFGVDTGSIHLLTFLKPVTQLFQSPFKSDGGVLKIFMQDIPSHSAWVRHQVLPDVHGEMIKQVRYLPESEFIISSSSSPRNTVIICHVDGVKKPYNFNIEKGVECFDYNRALNLLVTGSGDHLVRLWNPYVTSKAIAILVGHATGIVGVAIHEGFRQVISYSKDAVIKVWDVKEHSCLQTVVLKFPSSLHGRMPEHGQFPVHLQGPPHSALVLTCNDYIGALRLGQVTDTSVHHEVTHDTQLCAAIYNKYFKQVVTGCDSSTITVWDIETGNKSIVFSNAHGEEEITCLAFDQSNRRLISGARNGTVKVWNFQNGHNLHKLEPVGEAEITGLIQLSDKKVILTVGWNQLITTYDDTDADSMYIKANNNWKGGQLHKDDILSADFSPPNFLATASFDGEIIVWEADTEKIYIRLRKGQTPNISKKLDALKTKVKGSDDRPISQNSRPNSRHRSSHKVGRGQIAPVDKLLFLQARARVRFTESAVLISSEGGVLRWWNIYHSHKEMGNFYVPNIGDESVLAMCTKPNDSLLITGDTQGMVKCWDIMDYCTKWEGQISRATPPLEAVWKAHDSAIVSVEYIQHDDGTFILTASTDKTARLWTPEGHYIGTFGQKTPWNLKTPSTWAHPKTPWSKEEEEKAKKEGQKAQESVHEEEEEEIPQTTAVERETTDISVPGLDSKESSFSAPIPTSEKAPEPVSSSIEPVSSSIVLQPDLQCTSPALQALHHYRLTHRSHTFAFGFQRDGRSKTFLGIKVEKDLERRQRDRKGRRVQFGDVPVDKTSQFGKQCAPYHALTTPEWREVQLPQKIPLSSRMVNRGYTGENLTFETVKAMDFSYGLPDSPPTGGNQGAPYNNAGRRMTMSQPASRQGKRSARLPPITAGRSARPSLVGGLNKASTVL